MASANGLSQSLPCQACRCAVMPSSCTDSLNDLFRSTDRCGGCGPPHYCSTCIQQDEVVSAVLSEPGECSDTGWRILASGQRQRQTRPRVCSATHLNTGYVLIIPESSAFRVHDTRISLYHTSNLNCFCVFIPDKVPRRWQLKLPFPSFNQSHFRHDNDWRRHCH
jgi:hypothetical protein